jgi:hypothetical protein
MSVLFGRKTAGTKLSTINYARGLVVSLYIISWTFSLVSAMLVQTNNFNTISCTMSVYMCITLYAVSKIIIYLFLMEKVYVVTAVGTTRANFLVMTILRETMRQTKRANASIDRIYFSHLKSAVNETRRFLANSCFF